MRPDELSEHKTSGWEGVSEPAPWPGYEQTQREVIKSCGGWSAFVAAAADAKRRVEAGDVAPSTPEQEAQHRRMVGMLVDAGKGLRAPNRRARTTRRCGLRRRERHPRVRRRTARRGTGRRIASRSSASSDDGPGEPEPEPVRHLTRRRFDTPALKGWRIEWHERVAVCT